MQNLTCLSPPCCQFHTKTIPLAEYASECAVYVFVSYRLFILTGTLKEVVVPNKTGREMARNYVMLAATALALWMAGQVLVSLTGLKDFASPSIAVVTQPHFDP